MKNKIIILIFLFVLIGNASGQSTKQYHTMLKGMYKNTVAFIKASDLNSKLSELNSIVVLDTRKPAEYKASHIKGARFVNYDTFQLPDVKQLSKTDTIVVYCSVGYRSERIGEILRKAGFKNVFNLYGGLFEWVNAGFEVVDSADEKTAKIHGYDKDWGKWLTKGETVYE